MFWGVMVVSTPVFNYVNDLRHERVMRQVYVERDAQELAVHQAEIAAHDRVVEIDKCLEQGDYGWNVEPPGNPALDGTCKAKGGRLEEPDGGNDYVFIPQAGRHTNL